jgi:hypothetical protein
MNVSLRTLGVSLLGGCLAITLAMTAGDAAAQSNSLRSAPSRAEREADDPPRPEERRVSAPRPEERISRTQQPVRQASAYRPASYGFGEARPSQTGFVPRHQRAIGTGIVRQPAPEPMPDETIYEEIPGDIQFEGTHFEGEDCGHQCSGSGCRGCLIPCPSLCFNNLEVFGGVQGFKGPLNLGADGSFGFHEGVNWTNQMPCMPCSNLSMQLGFQTVQSNLSGSQYSNDSRDQWFVTGGFYRRVDCGWQGGVVLDYLRDESFFEMDLIQMRGEISWVFPCRHEIGFWYANSLRSDDVTFANNNRFTQLFGQQLGTRRVESTDLYSFFYRRRFDCGGQGRVFAGFSGESDGLLGGDIWLPINNCWSFQADFTYLIPQDDSAPNGSFNESWNVAFNLVWRPGGRASHGGGVNRPLFNVANNGSFLTRFVNPVP